MVTGTAEKAAVTPAICSANTLAGGARTLVYASWASIRVAGAVALPARAVLGAACAFGSQPANAVGGAARTLGYPTRAGPGVAVAEQFPARAVLGAARAFRIQATDALDGGTATTAISATRTVRVAACTTVVAAGARSGAAVTPATARTGSGTAFASR